VSRQINVRNLQHINGSLSYRGFIIDYWMSYDELVWEAFNQLTGQRIEKDVLDSVLEEIEYLEQERIDNLGEY
jgi:hypothetical protein